MMRRLHLYLSLLLVAVGRLSADTSQALGEWDSVTIEPVKTSIYVGTVTLTTGELAREGDRYTSTYEAKVWPWFFWSETGRISITLPDHDLARLARGERVVFAGEARNHKNKPRTISGHADRTDAANGKIKVRIGVDDTELIFNSTYRLNNVLK